MGQFIKYLPLFLALFSLFVVVRYRLLSFSGSERQASSVGLFSLLIALLLYAVCGIYSPVAIKQLLNQIGIHNFPQSIYLITQLFTTLIVLVSFTRLLRDDLRYAIWGKDKTVTAVFKSLATGCFIAVLLYPIVIVVVEGVHLIVHYISPFERNQQVALLQLKLARANPWLFGILAFQVGTIVPIVEELLFRGFFQNFFISIFGPYFGIFCASAIFTFFHFSPEQGITNIELLVGLFFLSCCIGAVYVREKSLWAPIGMHVAFNSITLLLMAYI